MPLDQLESFVTEEGDGGVEEFDVLHEPLRVLEELVEENPGVSEEDNHGAVEDESTTREYSNPNVGVLLCEEEVDPGTDHAQGYQIEEEKLRERSEPAGESAPLEISPRKIDIEDLE